MTLQIRAAVPADGAGIAAVYAPVVAATVISFEQTPPDADEMTRRMLVTPRLPWLVAQREDEVVGFAYGSAHRARAAYRWAVECSVYLAPSQHRRGTGRALYTRLFDALRELGYVRVLAGITLPNVASVGLHEAMGFEPVGVYRQVGFKDGRWHDVGWWQLTVMDLPSPPSEPKEWSG